MLTEPSYSQARKTQACIHIKHSTIQRSRHKLAGLGLCLGAACTSLLGVDPTKAKSTTFYSMDNDNNIWEMNPVTRSNNLVNEVGLTNSNCTTTTGYPSLTKDSNGIAYNTARDQLFFFYKQGAGTTTYDLLTWNPQSTCIGSLQTIRTLNGSSTPANAAYYNNALWYFNPNILTVLNQLTFDYTGNTITGSNLTSVNLNNYTSPHYPASFFGDIAINTKTGLLYGSRSNGNCYSIDLNNLNNTSNAIYADLRTINTFQGSSFGTATQTICSLQLSFNADYGKLSGTQFCNSPDNCNGYTVNGQPFSPATGDGLFFAIANFSRVTAQRSAISAMQIC
jgi:hypothetical protein